MRVHALFVIIQAAYVRALLAPLEEAAASVAALLDWVAKDASQKRLDDAARALRQASDALRPVAAAVAESRGRSAVLSRGISDLCSVASRAWSAAAALSGAGFGDSSARDTAPTAAAGQDSHVLGKRRRPPDGEQSAAGAEVDGAAARPAPEEADALARGCLRVLCAAWLSEEALLCRSSEAGSRVVPWPTVARLALNTLQRWRAACATAGGRGGVGGGEGAAGAAEGDSRLAAAAAALLTLAMSEGSTPSARPPPQPAATASAIPAPLRELLVSEAFFRDSWEQRPLSAQAGSAAGGADDPVFQALVAEIGDAPALVGSLVARAAACPPLGCDDPDSVGALLEAGWKVSEKGPRSQRETLPAAAATPAAQSITACLTAAPGPLRVSPG